MTNGPEIQWKVVHQNITEILDRICPIKQLTVVENKPEWLTNELLVMMRQREKARDWVHARKMRNRANMEVKTSKSRVIQDKLERFRHNPEKCWFEINKLLANSKSTFISGIFDGTTGDEVQDNQLMDHVNDYFSAIGSKLANECTPGTVGDETRPLRDNLPAFNITPFTEVEVLKVCKDININKSSSLPNIKSHVLKHAFITNITRITKMFNASLLYMENSQCPGNLVL